MAENNNGIRRRDFFKGAAMGVLGGPFAAMGVFSYSPWRRTFFPEINRKLTDIGACKSVKVTNISETSWFENAVLMGDIKGRRRTYSSTSTAITGRPSATAPAWQGLI